MPNKEAKQKKRNRLALNKKLKAQGRTRKQYQRKLKKKDGK
tara:strand:- start:583 stop:705 length:123 start_codon:yes stop_codon:yes gene_type:complete